jgi:hypothetical protein
MTTINLNGSTYFKLSDLETVELNGETYVKPPFPGQADPATITDQSGDTWVPGSNDGKWRCIEYPHLDELTREQISSYYGIEGES